MENARVAGLRVMQKKVIFFFFTYGFILCCVLEEAHLLS